MGESIGGGADLRDGLIRTTDGRRPTNDRLAYVVTALRGHSRNVINTLERAVRF